MNIVVDSSLSPRIARLLAAVLEPEHRAMHQNDLATGAATDAGLADHLASLSNALLLGLDLEITGHPHRLAALRELGCSVALLSPEWFKVPPPGQAWMLLRLLPRLLKRVQEAKSPVLLTISAGNQPSIRKAA